MSPEFEIQHGVLKKYHGIGGDVVIPEGVASIDSAAFLNCTGLISITIPESVTSIGIPSFPNCTNLNKIIVSEHNAEYTDDDGVLYDKSLTKLMRCPPARKQITILKSVASISESALLNCSRLTEVILPEGVTSIGVLAFFGCTGLTSIRIPESVISIKPWAFKNCTNLYLRYLHYIFSPHTACSPWINQILRMARMKQFSSEIPSSWIYRAVFEMYFSSPEEEKITAYISENITEMFKLFVDTRSIDAAKKILESGQFITGQNIDSLIQYAIQQKAYEIQVLLTDYKYQHFDNFGKDLKL